MQREVWTSFIHGRATLPFWFEFSNILKCHCTPITIYFSVVQLVMWKIFFLDLKGHIYLQYSLRSILVQDTISCRLQTFSTVSDLLSFHIQQSPQHNYNASYICVERWNMSVCSYLLEWVHVGFTDTPPITVPMTTNPKNTELSPVARECLPKILQNVVVFCSITEDSL